MKTKELDHEEVIEKIRESLKKKGLSIQDMYFLTKRMEEDLFSEIMGDDDLDDMEDIDVDDVDELDEENETEEGDELDEEIVDETGEEPEKPKITSKKPKVRVKDSV